MERFVWCSVISWEEYDDETIDSFNLILKSLCILVEDFPECKEGIQRVFGHLLDMYTHFPSNNYLECVADGFIYLYLIPALRYLETEEILPALLRLTVYRQPQITWAAVMQKIKPLKELKRYLRRERRRLWGCRLPFIRTARFSCRMCFNLSGAV